MPVINTDAGRDEEWGISQLTQSFRLPSLHALLLARDEKCDGDAAECEKPVASSHITLGIVVGSVAALVLITGSILTFLHCRRSRRDRADDAAHAHELADYGIYEDSGAASSVKKPRKARSPDSSIHHPVPHHGAGLAPPNRRLSSDSLSSLARSIRGREDPFGSNAEVVRTDSSNGGWKEEGQQRPTDPFR